jgi:hypothetical protein
MCGACDWTPEGQQSAIDDLVRLNRQEHALANYDEAYQRWRPYLEQVALTKEPDDNSHV